MCITPSEKHIDSITGNAYELLRNIKVAFTYINEGMIKKADNDSKMLQIRICSYSMVTEQKEAHKETRKNTKGSNKVFSRSM